MNPGVFQYQAKTEPIVPPAPPPVSGWYGPFSQPVRQLVSAALVGTTLAAGPVFVPPAAPAVPTGWNQPQPTYVPAPAPVPTGEFSGAPLGIPPAVDWFGESPRPRTRQALPQVEWFTLPPVQPAALVVPKLDWAGQTSQPPRALRPLALWVPTGEVPFGVQSQLPPSLDAAIVAWWNGSSGLASAIGPIFTEIANAGRVVPFVLLSVPDEGGHGMSREDKQVEVWFSVLANDLTVARGLGNQIKDALNPELSGRLQWAWQRGTEMGTFAENKGQKEKAKGTDKNGNPVWCWHLPVTTFITGDV